jgi:hypothetical protein
MVSFAMLGCVFDGHILLENWEVPSVPSFFVEMPPYSSPYSSRWYFVRPVSLLLVPVSTQMSKPKIP